MWFSSLVNSLWSPRLSHAQPIRLFPHTSLPKNLQTNLTPFPAEILPRSAVHVPIRKDRDIEKTRTRTLSSVKGTASSADPNEEDIINPDVSFFLNLGPLDGESASPTDSDRGPYIHPSSLITLLSNNIVIPLSRSARRDPTQFWGLSMVCTCAPPSRVACVPSSSLMPSPQPQTLYPLLTMSITDHRRREREYGSLSYLHHIVIGLHKVHRLVHTVTNTKELGTCGLTTLLPFFPVLPLMSTLPELVASFKPFSVLICHSPRRTLSTHGTMPSLLRPQNLACAHDGVSPGPCMSLGEMRSEVSSLVICTSSGLRPNLVGDFLRSVFIQTLLIPVYSPIIQRSILKPSSRAYSSHSLQS